MNETVLQGNRVHNVVKIFIPLHQQFVQLNLILKLKYEKVIVKEAMQQQLDQKMLRKVMTKINQQDIMVNLKLPPQLDQTIHHLQRAHQPHEFYPASQTNTQATTVQNPSSMPRTTADNTQRQADRPAGGPNSKDRLGYFYFFLNSIIFFFFSPFCTARSTKYH